MDFKSLPNGSAKFSQYFLCLKIKKKKRKEMGRKESIIKRRVGEQENKTR